MPDGSLKTITVGGSAPAASPVAPYGPVPGGDPPEAFASFLRPETETWGNLPRDPKVTID